MIFVGEILTPFFLALSFVSSIFCGTFIVLNQNLKSVECRNMVWQKSNAFLPPKSLTFAFPLLKNISFLIINPLLDSTFYKLRIRINPP